MELVSKLRENYKPAPQEVLDNADTGSSIPELVRNLTIDIGSGAAIGAAGGAIGAKIAAKKPAQAATTEALESLKEGADDALGHQKSLVKKGTSHNQEVLEMMDQNEAAAKSVAEGGNGKKALRTILKNTRREAEIGPRFMADIQYILEKDAGLSEKEVKKAITEWMKDKKNANAVELITLIEAKEPIATYSHSLGVQDLAYKLAKKAGLDETRARKIGEAALVHDIGKIQVPDSVISSVANFDDYPNLRAWMNEHDIAGGDILIADPFKSKIAGGHHPKGNRINVDKDVGIVTVADLYEAMTSSKRSYKPSLSMDEALTEINKKVKNDYIKEEYLSLLKALKDDKLLKDRYDFKSPLEDAYKSMKANEIKKQVASDYSDAYFKEAAKKYVPFGAGIGAGISAGVNAAKGGVEPSDLPTLSEIISAFSPSFKTKAEKLEDIKRWYNNGFYNDEINELIVNTDFKDNEQVTKLWKLMHDQFKD